MNSRLLVIDADSLIYRVGFSAEPKQYLVWDNEDREYGPIAVFKKSRDADKWINGETDRYEKEVDLKTLPLDYSINYLDNIINSIIWRYRSNDYKIFVESNEPNYKTFRHKICPDYKKDRDVSNRPSYYKSIFHHLVGNWRAYVVGDGLEADDVVAINCCREPDSVCVSIDKDLNQIQGVHYNPNKRLEYSVDSWGAIKNLYIQALTGDTVDNIKGVEGIGPVKANKILTKDNIISSSGLREYERSLFESCLWAYKGDYERLNINLKLLYLLRNWGDKWRPPMTLEETLLEANSS